MKALAARVDAEWRAFTPLHDHTLQRARAIAWGDAGTYAGAVVGVYGSGKSALLLALLREARGHGTVVVWEEAAPLLERLLPDGQQVLPQAFAERVIAFVNELASDSGSGARERYLVALRARGQGDVADAVAAQLVNATPPGNEPPRILLLLDEVEQAHEILRRRIAADDGQPLRALIDGTSAGFRLLLAYAPESFHSVGDADRGRLAYLPVPSLDVAAIQATFGLSRGHASFVWWISRGRARGAIAAVRTVVEPLKRGAFEGGLDDLGDALAALPGVFGVPAIVREGLLHEDLRALVDLTPRGVSAHERGIVCSVRDRGALADAMFLELSRRVATSVDLLPVANELVAVLAAVADDEEYAFLTMDDFRATLRMAEARALESGRQKEPIERFADQALLAFPALGEMTALTKRLPLSVAALAEERFPSPFTDPYLPLTHGGRIPTPTELARALRSETVAGGPLFRSDDADFSVFADEAALAIWIENGGLDGSAEPLRVVLLASSRVRPPLVDLAHAAGRLRVCDIGPFHGTFLACLAVRTRGTHALDASVADARETAERAIATGAEGRQIARKIQWHLERIALLLREAKPSATRGFATARRFVRDDRLRSVIGRLKVGSPALLALLLPLAPLGLQERRCLHRLAKLLDGREAIRKVARLVNPGGRLSGAAVVVDELLPAHGEAAGWTAEPPEGARELGDLLATFGRDPAIRERLARWLLPEDAAKLSSLFGFHAGELPDISVEHDQLGALSQLDRTRRRVDGIVANLGACTGRPDEIVRGLRLGVVTEQVRASGGPIDGLAKLTADIEAAGDGVLRPWVRTLALWICGVFADRLLTGVEKEQADLAAWEQLATTTRDLGARATELSRTLCAIGADACDELLSGVRRRISNHLSSRDDLEASVRALRDLCVGLEPVATSLGQLVAALRERDVVPVDALATYLPDEDGVSAHHLLFKRLPELLEEIEGPCPAPLGRSLLDYAELLRRHAEGTRHDRLRTRLEAVLDLSVPNDLRLDDEAVTAIERTWQGLPTEGRRDLHRALQAAPLPPIEELERLLVQTDRKLTVVAGWAGDRRGEASILRGLDGCAIAYARRAEVPLSEVQRLDGERRRVLALIDGLPAMVRPSVAQNVIQSAEALDASTVFAAVLARLEELSTKLGAWLEMLQRLGSSVPTEIPEDGADEVLGFLRDRAERAQRARDEALVSARAIGLSLAEWGERAATIPGELNAPQAVRLCERERERLRGRLAEEASALATALARAGLGAALFPRPQTDDVLAWSGSLLATRRAWLELAPSIAELGSLEGVGLDGLDQGHAEPPIDRWETARDLVREALERAHGERRKLTARLDAARARAKRLGAGASEDTRSREGEGEARVIDESLPALRERLRRAELQVERLRASRLREASSDARAAYAAIRGAQAAALPPAIGDLVALGLIVAVEDVS